MKEREEVILTDEQLAHIEEVTSLCTDEESKSRIRTELERMYLMSELMHIAMNIPIEEECPNIPDE